MWVPGLYFTNEKSAHFHDITVPNKLMQIYPNGSILYSARVSLTLTCDMGLVKFPFDQQICSILLESYIYTTKNVIFHWHDDPIQRRANLKLPQFEISDMSTTNHCSMSDYSTGKLFLYRYIRYHLLLVVVFGCIYNA